MKTRPRADCGSDRQLLAAVIRLELKEHKSDSRPIIFDVGCVLQLWKEVKEIVLIAAAETIPRKTGEIMVDIANSVGDGRQTADSKGPKRENTMVIS